MISIANRIRLRFYRLKNNRVLVVALHRILSIIYKGKRSTLKNNQLVAKTAMANEDWTRAAEIWQSILDNSEKVLPVNVYVQLCRSYYRLGEFDSADIIIQLGFERYPYNRKLAYEYGEVAMARANWPEAIARWTLYLKAYDEVPNKIYIRLSRAYLMADCFFEAEKYLQKAKNAGTHNFIVKREERTLLYKIKSLNWRMKRDWGLCNWEKSIGVSFSNLKWSEVISRIKQSFKITNYNDVYKQFINAQLFCADELNRQGEHISANAIMRETLDLYRGKLSNKLIRYVSKAIEYDNATARTSSEQAKNKENMVSELLKINPNDMTFEAWLGLYDILNWHGLLNAGLVARNKSIKRIFTEAETGLFNSKALIKSIQASVEKGDLKRAEDYLDQLAQFAPENQVNNLWKYIALNKGDLEFFSAAQYSQRTGPFSDYIKGKNVAIVGPAADHEEAGAEIDSYDVVVRFNYFGNEKMIDRQKEFGSKTNISYYNVSALRYMLKEGKTFYLKDLDFYVFKKFMYDFINIDLYKGLAKQLISNDHFFYKSPSAGPDSVYDLLSYAPAKIKIFKSNFYLNSQQYAAGYADSKEFRQDSAYNMVSKLRPIVSLHDLVSQLSFMRNMWYGDVIEVDAGCSEVLGLTDQEYISAMERIYCNIK